MVSKRGREVLPSFKVQKEILHWPQMSNVTEMPAVHWYYRYISYFTPISIVAITRPFVHAP